MSTTETPPTPETPETQPAPPTPEPEAANAAGPPPEQPPADPSPSLGLDETSPEPVSGKYSAEKSEFFATLDAVERAVHNAQTLPQAKDAVTTALDKVRQKIADLEAQD